MVEERGGEREKERERECVCVWRMGMAGERRGGRRRRLAVLPPPVGRADQYLGDDGTPGLPTRPAATDHLRPPPPAGGFRGEAADRRRGG